MKKHIPLIIGLLLPIIFIVVMAIVVYLPSMGIKPEHNFLYTTSGASDYYYNNRPQYTEKYDIDSAGRLTTIKEEVVVDKNRDYGYTPKQGAPELYLYDVKAETSKQVTLEEAQKFVLERGPSSPDGYSVVYDYNNSGGLMSEIVGGRSGYSGYVMSKGKAKKKIVGLTNTYYYSQNLLIIGWIK